MPDKVNKPTRDSLFTESGERVHEMALVVIDALMEQYLVACGVDGYAIDNISLVSRVKLNNLPARFNSTTFPMNSINQIERRKTNLMFVEANHTAEYLRHCSDK